MMTEERTVESVFFDNFEKQYKEVFAQDALKKLRKAAWDRFLQLGLPTRQNEVFKYIKLRQLFSKELTASFPVEVDKDFVRRQILPGYEKRFLVFVNGFFRKELSSLTSLPEKCQIEPLAKATRTYGAFLNNHIIKTMKEETDPFAAVNAALWKDGIFVYLPPNLDQKVSFQMIHIIHAEDEKMHIVPRFQAFVGKLSELSIVTTTCVLSGSDFVVNEAKDFVIEDGASVTYIPVNVDMSKSSWHFSAVRAVLKRDSKFQSIEVQEGSCCSRTDFRVVLDAENAEALLDGVWMLKDDLQAHTNILMDHRAPNCKSRQLYKSVLKDMSRSSFEGKILVRKLAQKTDAFQLNNNLLLSDAAHADSKPNLEIFADDVKASHGATVGKLNQEHLFYLKSRGIEDAVAKDTLVYAFCKEVLDLIPNKQVTAFLEKRAKFFVSL